MERPTPFAAVLHGAIEDPVLRRLQLGTAYLQHLTLSGLNALHPEWTYADYFSFASVRNPWDSVLSSY